MIDFSWNPEHLPAFTAIAALTIGFLIYLGVYLSPKFLKNLKEKNGEDKGVYYWVVTVKLLGFFLLGVLSIVLILFYLKEPLSAYGMGPITKSSTYWWMLIGGGIILTLNIIQGRRPANYNIYPLIRFNEWDLKTLVVSLVTSTLFIVGYEIMFRGFLLYACIPVMGVWLAIAVNVIIYSFAHIHKGMTETIGSVPFGILLCYITLSTGNIWAIVVMHVILSLSADVVGLYFNPEMRVKRGGSN